MARTPRTRFTVEVTERDIERAHRNDSYNCVVSQAIARTIPDATRIETDSQTIRFSTEGERRIYLTPYAVQGYVIAFDAGDPIEPFSFQLRDPKRITRKVRTEAGLEADRAYRRAKTSGDRKVSASKKSSTGKSDAKAAYDEARARHGDAPLTTTVAGDRSAAPPRVFKKKTRTYGHRLLRINQQEGKE